MNESFVLHRKSNGESFAGVPAWIPLFTCLLSLPGIAQVTEVGTKLTAYDFIGKPQQGFSVSLSGDGNTAIMGGPFDTFDFGAAWIFARVGGGDWIQQSMKLIGTGVIATNAPLQGWSVAVSADGTTAIVGGIEDRAESGSAWIFTRGGGFWTQQAKLADLPYQPGGQPGQGYSVALSAHGDTALVGAVGYDDLCCGAAVFAYRQLVPASTPWPGSVTPLGGGWAGPTVLAGNEDEMLGPAVALSSDGSTAIMQVITVKGVAAVAVFVWNGGTWARQSTLSFPGGIANAVALSGDGNTALVGVPGDNEGIGAAWVFTRADGLWGTQGSKLVGSGAIGRAEQGVSVAISAAGNIAVVGGPGDDDQTGAAWLFRWDGNTWTQADDKLVGPGGAGNARQGLSVAISGDGGTAMIGGPGDDSGIGAVWTYLIGGSYSAGGGIGFLPRQLVRH